LVSLAVSRPDSFGWPSKVEQRQRAVNAMERSIWI
jgi:hypothetical protein